MRHRRWAKENKVKMQVDAAKGAFAKRWPRAASKVTTYREMEALDLLTASGHETDFVANTSQNLTHMPIKNDKEPMMSGDTSADSSLDDSDDEEASGCANRYLRGSAKSMLEQDDGKLQEELLQKLVDHKLTGATLQLSFYCNPTQLPPKFLPHGNLSCLFALYCAYSNAVEGQEPAGRSIFYTALKSIDYAFQHSRRQGLVFPTEYWLQGDNAVKEVRNESMHRLMVLLLQGGFFRQTTAAHLEKGHTHEDVDAALSVVTAALNACSDLQSPRDVIRALENRVAPMFQRSGMECRVELLEAVHDWNKIMPNNVHLYGAYKDRKQKDGEERMAVPQQFTFIRRQDMPSHGRLIPTEERLPIRLRNGGQDKDIFALTKLRMSSDHLSQDPLLIYPEGFLASTRHFWTRIANPDSDLPVVSPHLDAERCKELEQLCNQIEIEFPHMGRACNYYRSLIDPDQMRPRPTRFEFINLGPSADEQIGDVMLGEPGRAPKPYKLRVLFRREPDAG
ncbi:unnamed protein product [Durusdinium trenchii]|uniref:DUF7869 domain-containing protein n=1 Tax=Durusdinium trenchii TaxID=1381693 RepID=A0ABP0L048_9DINO